MRSRCGPFKTPTSNQTHTDPETDTFPILFLDLILKLHRYRHRYWNQIGSGTDYEPILVLESILRPYWLMPHQESVRQRSPVRHKAQESTANSMAGSGKARPDGDRVSTWMEGCIQGSSMLKNYCWPGQLHREQTNKRESGSGPDAAPISVI